MLPLTPDMTLADRMVLAVERVRDRLSRACLALDAAQVPFAVAGGNAVAAWVSTVDESAIRNTPDVDILLRRSDMSAAKRALESAEFQNHDVNNKIFLDGPDAKLRNSVHIIIANEKHFSSDAGPAPDIGASEIIGGLPMLTLEALAYMNLLSSRSKDQLHLRDLIDVGLIDSTWVTRFPPPLAARLQLLIDTPDQ